MLKRKYRLKVARLSNPKTYVSSFFNAKIVENQLPYSRFAFIISKKVDKRATARNKIRRRVSEGVEQMIEGLKGKDILIYPKKEVLDAKQEDVKKEAETFLKKL